MDIFANGEWLPLSFAFLMGLSMLIYAVLDGYDLGVGVLMKGAEDDEKDLMIGSIGPFWDANETWLVLGVGLLLVAFPAAHGIILSNLYLPVAIMLIGLILRGVAFDFRAKARVDHKNAWNNAFFCGSLITSMAQGYMLGSYIIGFEKGVTATAFSMLIGLCVVAGYCLIGAAWLIMKTEGELQRKAVRWARMALMGTLIGIVLVSIATPLVSARIFEKWFSFPNIVLLAPVPIITGVLIVALEILLRQMPKPGDRWCWVPFATIVGIFILCFHGLAYSFYPYIVPDQLKIVEAASAPESLKIILAGALVVLPVLIGYTFLAYKIFHGKAKELTYE
ncbi:MAG: cytochrome d ubiquinol oxidase subunit II [Micavibrio aeruginosavorus]|uniref:Cytochrome d ubiquinol oxidase subunit II n=1 Tax=Micavibrio aeruginosavorus TaxID=349221 RepID=A0A2W5A1W1_9BACT|nr:MAG: cytochrome d ubiquinol oxidase subunit II [Micavibrio aeruginosavorus]